VVHLGFEEPSKGPNKILNGKVHLKAQIASHPFFHGHNIWHTFLRSNSFT
jgi:hypothetical protein